MTDERINGADLRVVWKILPMAVGRAGGYIV
jgi:hypothetical protein